MRARYSAYASGNVDFVLASNHPKTRDGVDRASTEVWSKESEWLGLDIISTEAGGVGDQVGSVEFLARYRLRGVTIPHREKARFEVHEGKWYFVEGEEIHGPPVHREGPRVGRNDPCPCGSGKKYKKCCATKA